MEICFCCRSSMSLLSPDGRREKGRPEWASIVLCSRPFTHTHLPNHTHSLLLHNEINALSFPLWAQHLSARGFLWSNTTSCSATSDTDANTVQLLYLCVAVHSHCIRRNKGSLYFDGCFDYVFFFGWTFLCSFLCFSCFLSYCVSHLSHICFVR